MNICAFDLSLVATGWASYHADHWPRPAWGTTKSGNLRGVERLQILRDDILHRAEGYHLVVIEGYAFARTNQAHQLGELGGVVRVALADRGQRYIEIPPASVKLFGAGRGNATKDEMLAEAIRRLDYDGHDHNEADALWLLRMTECGVGLRTPENDHQRRALAKAITYLTHPQERGHVNA